MESKNIYKHLLDTKYTMEYKLDLKTKARAAELLRDYCGYHKGEEAIALDDLDVHATVRVAILIGSKYSHIDLLQETGESQLLTMCGLSTSMFLHSRPSIMVEDFHKKIQEFSGRVYLTQSVKQEIFSIQNKLSVAFNLYQKFTTIWTKAGVKDRALSFSSAETIKKVAWLIFILAKIKILKGRCDNIVDSAYLLCAVVHQVLMLLPKEVTCDMLENFKQLESEDSLLSGESKASVTQGLKVGAEAHSVMQGLSDHLVTDLMAQIRGERDPLVVAISQVKAMLLKFRIKQTLKVTKAPYQTIDESEVEAFFDSNVNEKLKHVYSSYPGLVVPSGINSAGQSAHSILSPSGNQVSGGNLISQFENLEQFSQTIPNESFCQLQSKVGCLHGILDSSSLNQNWLVLDETYSRKVIDLTNVDERYFISSDGRLRTPLKLMSPFTFRQGLANQKGGPHAPYPNQKRLDSSAMPQRHMGDDKISESSGSECLSNGAQRIKKRSHGSMSGSENSGHQYLKHKRPREVNSTESEAGISRPNKRPAFQKRLDFSSCSLKSVLNTVQFPNMITASPTPSTPAARMGGNSMIPQTPISQMMDLNQWVVEQQNTVKLDPSTEFLQSFSVTFPKQDKSYAMKIAHTIKGYLKKVIDQLAQQSVKQTFQTGFADRLEKDYGQPMYKLACSLIERMLKRETFEGVPADQCFSICKNHVFQKSMVVYACSIQLYSQSVIVDLPFKNLLAVLELPSYNFWCTMEAFLELDRTMPKPFKDYFLEQERQIVQYMSWQEGSPFVQVLKDILVKQRVQMQRQQMAGTQYKGVVPLSQMADERQKEDEEAAAVSKILRPYEVFFRRLLQVTAQTVLEMSKILGLGDKVRELVWNVMKVLLSQETEMLVGRHLDQMIMCAIYGVCRIHPKLLAHINEPGQDNGSRQGSDMESPAQAIVIKFNTIIEAYREMTSKQKCGITSNLPGSCGVRNMTWVLIDVPIDVEKGVNANIIDFYNKVFLPRMAESLKASRTVSFEQGSQTPVINRNNLETLLTPGGCERRPQIRDLCPQTPLIEAVSHQASAFGMARAQNQGLRHVGRPPLGQGLLGSKPTNEQLMATPGSNWRFQFGTTPSKELSNCWDKSGRQGDGQNNRTSLFAMQGDQKQQQRQHLPAHMLKKFDQLIAEPVRTSNAPPTPSSIAPPETPHFKAEHVSSNPSQTSPNIGLNSIGSVTGFASQQNTGTHKPSVNSEQK